MNGSERPIVKLQEATLIEAQLQETNLNEVQLQGAHLRLSRCIGEILYASPAVLATAVVVGPCGHGSAAQLLLFELVRPA